MLNCFWRVFFFLVNLESYIWENSFLCLVKPPYTLVCQNFTVCCFCRMFDTYN